MAGINVKELIK